MIAHGVRPACWVFHHHRQDWSLLFGENRTQKPHTGRFCVGLGVTEQERQGKGRETRHFPTIYLPPFQL